ncbi:MAG: PIG-L family deacetylase [Chloroflexi bacterium]|nr:PIG-L family deacetylase [Chloroflexota bacterium]
MRTLVIVAHPDDIEFGVAGSVARWTLEGADVAYCIVTDGSAGSNDPNIDKETLIRTRQAEQLAAAAVVGVEDVHFLNYPDGMLQPTLELRRDLTRLIRRLKPERVITMDPTVWFVDNPGYINHPDHRACAEAAIYATFPSAETRPIFPELLAEGLEPHKVAELWLMFSEKPNTHVDITAVIDRKIDSLSRHVSQVGGRDLSFVRGWDAEAGKAGGYEYAESYRVLRLTPPESDGTQAQDSASAQKDAAQKDAAQKDTAQKDAAQKDAAQKDAAQKDAAQ